MILIAGIPSETPLKLVIDELEKMNSPYLLFNQREFESINIQFEINQNRLLGILKIHDKEYALEDITSTYMRLMSENELPEISNEPENSPKRLHCMGVHEALRKWSNIAPIRVVNRLSSMSSNGSKPYQSQIIRKHGFLIPETLITNNPKKVLEFKEKHKKIIYKSISSVRSIVQILNDDDISRLNQISWCPVQFQQFIDGSNIRVHAIGNKVFATLIDSDTVDYRYADKQGGKAELHSINLSASLKEKCIKLARDMDLDFAGIDLKKTLDNKIFCFEVNPSPAYSYYESNTNQPISKEVAKYLSHKV